MPILSSHRNEDSPVVGDNVELKRELDEIGPVPVISKRNDIVRRIQQKDL